MNETALANFPETLWAGTEASLLVAAQAYARLNEPQARGGLFGREEDDTKNEHKVPYLFAQAGGIGVVSITGSLVNFDSPWNRYMGVTSYADITRAIQYAQAESSVSKILLYVSSGGGVVAGADDTARLIDKVNRTSKPVYTYSPEIMASAAYWLGSSGRKIYNSRTSLLGSIGVMMVAKNYAKALENEGVAVEVIRSGKFKALVNPHEPFNKAGLDQLKDQVDQLDTVFSGHVVRMRGMDAETFYTKAGQGREFVGAQAVSVGLSDGIKTFEEVLAMLDKGDLQESQYGRTQRIAANAPRSETDMPEAMTPEKLAAIAAQAGIPAPVAPDAAAKAIADAAAAEAKAIADAAAAAAATATTAAPAQPASAPADLVAFLRTSLTEAQAAIVALTVDQTKTKDQLAALQATADPMRKVVEASVSTMRVALSLPVLEFAGMTPEQLLAEHKSTAASFQKNLPVGGVAAVAPAENAKGVADSFDRRRLAAAAAQFAPTSK